jgi:hypothetical protein
MRLRELYESINLFENYQSKVNKLKTSFPDDAAAIDQKVQWAATYLKKNQAILWYLGILEAGLNRNQEALANLLPPAWLNDPTIFDSLGSVEYSLSHWLATEFATNKRIIDVVNAIRPGTNVTNVIAEFGKAEEQIFKDNEAARKIAKPIEILEGDHPVLQVPSTNNTWWHLPYNSHNPESKFMGHCGTCQFPENNLLSLRTSTPQPMLTFEWNPNTHELYQTKGPKNSKPSSKFYPDILALLLSPVVNGIGEDSWLPATDFSVFDLPNNMLNQIIATKPKLIDDQIEKYPIDFLRAPKNVLANERFRSVALDKSPGIGSLITEEGDIDLSNDAWENAIEQNNDLIIYAPDTIQNYKQRVGRRIGAYPELLNFASAKVRNDFEILKEAVYNNRRYDIFEHIPSHYKHYKELVKAAFESGNNWDLDSFDLQFIDLDICVKIVANSSDPSYAFADIENIGILNHQDIGKLLGLAVESNPHIVQYLRGDLVDDYLTFEQLKTAASVDGNIIDPSGTSWSLDDVVKPDELYELAIIALKTAPFLIDEFINRYSFTDEQAFNLCMSAAGARGSLNTLDVLIDHNFFKGGIQTFKIASKAIANGASLQHITPVADGESLPIDAGYVTADQYEQLAHQSVAIDGYNLKWINDNFKNFQLCKAAIKSNPTAFNFINLKLLTNEEEEKLRELAYGGQ